MIHFGEPDGFPQLVLASLHPAADPDGEIVRCVLEPGYTSVQCLDYPGCFIDLLHLLIRCGGPQEYEHYQTKGDRYCDN